MKALALIRLGWRKQSATSKPSRTLWSPVLPQLTFLRGPRRRGTLFPDLRGVVRFVASHRGDAGPTWKPAVPAPGRRCIWLVLGQAGQPATAR